jgi:hypothetical protein
MPTCQVIYFFLATFLAITFLAIGFTILPALGSAFMLVFFVYIMTQIYYKKIGAR